MPPISTDTERRPASAASDDEVERLSRELKDQVQSAKARICDRYVKLMENRTFAPSRRKA